MPEKSTPMPSFLFQRVALGLCPKNPRIQGSGVFYFFGIDGSQSRHADIKKHMEYLFLCFMR
ncbi:MAG TPA: hypothetical protein DHV15_04195 [Treponema sp.]|uniref:Uncharacterized protein n=1 Tax=Treponema denticola (strain ATCC 35405 / DSM 14222 / CIP 103919 / JCM 8153 / KCTC 15104) TaxID=243275 RepID=Q73KS6_TREDE|nr:hypothetical protein TDE_2141 [Treponema denticola ATCC 35405]HCY94699.1 hypothetical protein [Treponema sp.]